MQHLKFLVFFSSAFILLSCKKTEIPNKVEDTDSSGGFVNGLPEDFRKINGYLYASAFTSTNASFSSAYAAFGDTARDLMKSYDHVSEMVRSSAFIGNNNPNVSIGNITFSGAQIFMGASSTAIYYTNLNSSNGKKTYFANWKYDGNRSFKPVDAYIPRNFPTVIDSIVKNNDSLKINQGITFNLGKNIQNFDSVIVILSGYSPSKGSFQIFKRLSSSNTTCVYSSSDLEPFKPNVYYANLEVKLYNYSYIIINGKTYVYELSGEMPSKTLMVY